jgi:hypothetical protein
MPPRGGAISARCGRSRPIDTRHDYIESKKRPWGQRASDTGVTFAAKSWYDLKASLPKSV